jgi:hypothetical protein
MSMAQEKITLRYARLIGRIELLASALVTSGDPKLLEQDQKLFFQIEDDLAKIDLTSLPEAKVASLEEVVALLPKDNSFYGQEESAALSYIALLIRECFVKNKSLNADFHQKKSSPQSRL